MRVVITGGAGFLGYHVLRRIGSSEEVLVVDLDRHDRWKTLAPSLDKSIRLAKIDLQDYHSVFEAISNFEPECLVHLAATHYIPECEGDPVSCIRNNLFSTMNVLQASSGVDRFLFASSGAVYTPSSMPHKESDELGASDYYSFSKICGEQLVQFLRRDKTTYILRFFNLVGANESSPHLVPEIARQIRSGARIVELGNLHPTRDYVPVELAADVIHRLIMDPALWTRTLEVANVATGSTMSVVDIVDLVSRRVGRPVVIREASTRRRTVDRPHMAGDVGKAVSLGLFDPSDYDLEDSISSLWADL